MLEFVGHKEEITADVLTFTETVPVIPKAVENGSHYSPSVVAVDWVSTGFQKTAADPADGKFSPKRKTFRAR